MILGNNFLFLPDLLFILSNIVADTPFCLVIVEINYVKKLQTNWFFLSAYSFSNPCDDYGESVNCLHQWECEKGKKEPILGLEKDNSNFPYDTWPGHVWHAVTMVLSIRWGMLRPETIPVCHKRCQCVITVLSTASKQLQVELTMNADRIMNRQAPDVK